VMWFSVLGVEVVVVICLCFFALTVQLTKMPVKPAIYTDSWLRQLQARSPSSLEFLGKNSFCFLNVANGLRSGQVVDAESPR